MKPEWVEDVTHTVTFVGGFKISISKHGAMDWKLTCHELGLDAFNLYASSTEQAKQQAISLCAGKVRHFSESLDMLGKV